MSGSYFNKLISDSKKKSASCVSVNANPTIFELQAATLVICELWATTQPVCELWAVS